MVGPNPQQLMALVQIQVGEQRLVPPELLAGCGCGVAAAVGGGGGGGGDLAGVDLEGSVGCDEWGVGPVGLDPAALCGPVVGVPY